MYVHVHFKYKNGNAIIYTCTHIILFFIIVLIELHDSDVLYVLCITCTVMRYLALYLSSIIHFAKHMHLQCLLQSG